MEHASSNAEEQVAQLSKVPRTGWLIRGVEQPETVADHIFGMMVLAMLYDDYVKPYPASTVALALVHDIQELRTGDLTPRTKQYVPGKDPKTKYPAFEKEHFYAFSDSLPERCRTYFRRVWDEYAEKETERAKATHILDVVEMLCQAYEYEKAGQHKLGEFWRWVQRCKDVPRLLDLARTIERKRDFLRATTAVRFEHFEATYWHSGMSFSEKQIEQDKKRWSGRDSQVHRCFCNTSLVSANRIEVLDVGCGLGSFSRVFLVYDPKVEVKVVGIDINEFLLAEAKKHWNEPRFEAHRADIGWYWDFQSQRFDVVMVGEVLEHVFDPWLVMMEAFRVLKFEGLLFVSVPNSFNKVKMERMTEERKMELRWREEHIRYFGPDNLRQLLKETGFEVAEVYGLDEQWRDEPIAEDDAWTLLAFARKMSPSDIEAVGSVQGPGRTDPVRALAEWIADHSNTEGWSRIHKFIEEINKAKLLKVDFQDQHSESIAQQSFRLAFLAGCLAVGLSKTCDDAREEEAATSAIRCTLLQGIIETHISEFSTRIRATFDRKTRKEALTDILASLPASIASSYKDLFDSVLLASDEGSIARFLLAREYLKLGVDVRGNDYFGLTVSAEIISAALDEILARGTS